MAQFNIWVANVGVLAESHRSLDYRLKDMLEVRDLVAMLLGVLEKDLFRQSESLRIENENLRRSEEDQVSEAKSITENESDSSRSSTSSYSLLALRGRDEESSDPTLFLSKPQVAIQETIDQLHRLASTIRRSGTYHQQLRIERFLEKKDNKQVHDTIRVLALQRLNHLFPNASETLQQRMAKSIVRRRSRFLYIQRHQQKLSTLNNLPSLQSPLSTQQTVAKSQLQVDHKVHVLPLPKIVDDARSTGIFSNTKVTKLDPKSLRTVKNDYPASVKSVYIPQSGFPVQPKVLEKGGSFMCPYCCLEYPAKETQISLWTQHVIRDFEPYFCIFDDCKAPFESLDSYTAWIIHMQENHTQSEWHCAGFDHGSKTLHFYTQEDFEQHVRDAHDEHISQPLLSALTKHSIRATHIFSSCPFCGGLPEELASKFPNQDNIEAQEALRKHVRDHLIAVALILPPIRFDENDGDGQSQGSSAQGKVESTFNPDEAIFYPVMQCDRESEEGGCDCRYDKFNSVADYYTIESLANASVSVQGLRLPATHDDPSFLAASQKTRSLDMSEVEFEWGFWQPFSLPPYCTDISPPETQLDDKILAAFAKNRKDHVPESTNPYNSDRHHADAPIIATDPVEQFPVPPSQSNIHSDITAPESAASFATSMTWGPTAHLSNVETHSATSTHIGDRLLNYRLEWPELSLWYFIPISVLNQYVKDSDVENVLKEMDPRMATDRNRCTRYRNFIWQNSKKIFTILVCEPNGLNRAKVIIELVKEGIVDRDLPLCRGYYRENGRRLYVLCRKNHESCKKSDHRNCGIKAISSWSERELVSLERDQWLVQAPIFRRQLNGIPHYNLHFRVVMPFTEDAEKDPTRIKHGRYGDVWPARIHPAHQDLIYSLHSDGPLVAIKKLHPGATEAEFNQEKNVLTDITKRNHRHLVKLLATYTLNGNYHLIFPYAPANLSGYWGHIDLPYWNTATVLWFLLQLYGLSSGLEAIHKFSLEEFQASESVAASLTQNLTVHLQNAKDEIYIRHGDLKPENILWSMEPETLGFGGTVAPGGILQIAGFGLGRFHGLESRSEQDPKEINGSPTYAPPEIALEKPVSRAYDIWSMGCIFLEFITWLLGGDRGLTTFNNSRILATIDDADNDTYYALEDPGNTGRPYAVVRKAVIEWIAHLRKSPRCSPMAIDLLILIENGMLKIEAWARLPVGDIVSEVQRILQKGRQNEGYLLGNKAVINRVASIKVPLN